LQSLVYDAGPPGPIVVFFCDRPAVAHLGALLVAFPRVITLQAGRSARFMPSGYDRRSDKVLARRQSAP